MNVNVEPRATSGKASAIAIADCDIHPLRRTPNDFDLWLPARWREHLRTFGRPRRLAMQAGPAYPKGQPDAERRAFFRDNARTLYGAKA
jgi:uncharacterized protein